LYGLLQDFVARFSDIDAIYRRMVAVERRQVQPRWWQRLWDKVYGRLTSECARILAFMTTLDENQVINVTCESLGFMTAAHLKFQEHHQPHGPAAAAAGQTNSFPADTVDDPSHVISFTATAIPACSSGQMALSHCQALPVAEALEVPEADASLACFDSEFQLSRRDESIELEEIVVHAPSFRSSVFAPSTHAAITSQLFTRKQQKKRRPPGLELEEVLVQVGGLPSARQQARSAPCRPEVHAPAVDAVLPARPYAVTWERVAQSEVVSNAAIVATMRDEQFQGPCTQLKQPGPQYDGREGEECASRTVAVQAAGLSNNQLQGFVLDDTNEMEC
jgi:hypothetical protein